MTISKNISALTLLLSGFMITACDTAQEPAALEESQTTKVEVTTAIAKKASSTTAVVVEKSTELSETAFIATTAVKTTTATITALDLESRQATLTDKEGKSFAITARDDTSNLEQVSVGDTVNTKHVQQVIIKLLEGKNIAPSSSIIENSVQADEGQMPLRADSETVVDVYTVEEINIEANSFKLKDIEGNIEEFIAKDPKNLARANVGDSVIVTITDAFAVEVIKAELK